MLYSPAKVHFGFILYIFIIEGTYKKEWKVKNVLQALEKIITCID
jgi:hypothetical protein